MSKELEDAAAVLGTFDFEDEDRYMLTVRLPYNPPTNASDQTHWRTRSRMVGRLRKTFSILVPQHLRPPETLNQAAVTITRFSPKRPDYDGLVHSGKYVLDCIHSKVGGLRPIVQDDDNARIGRPEYCWRKTMSGRAFMEIIVIDRPPWVWHRG